MLWLLSRLGLILWLINTISLTMLWLINTIILTMLWLINTISLTILWLINIIILTILWLIDTIGLTMLWMINTISLTMLWLIKGLGKAVVRYKIDPNRFKTTYRSVLTFEEKKQSISHLFKTFSTFRLGRKAFILAKRSKNTVHWTFQNQRHFECEIPRELF